MRSPHGSRSGAARSSACPPPTCNALVAALAAEGVVTSSRDDNLRISAHCYNTADDVRAVLDVLGRNRALLKPA